MLEILKALLLSFICRLAKKEEYWGPTSAHQRDLAVISLLFVAIRQLKPLEAPDPLPLSYEEHSEALQKLLFRAKNQQRVTKFWQHLQTPEASPFTGRRRTAHSTPLQSSEQFLRGQEAQKTAMPIRRASKAHV
jgi:hypothetical protein